MWSEYQDTPRGKHIHLNFNLLVVIGLIHSVDWTYLPRLHWRYLMCHNWSVIAPCFLLLLHLLMNYARLGATWQHPDKTFTANKQMKWVRSQSLTLVNGLAELSRMQIKASTSVTATAMLNAFIFQGGEGGFKWALFLNALKIRADRSFFHGFRASKQHHNIFNLFLSSCDGWWLSGQVDLCRSLCDPC